MFPYLKDGALVLVSSQVPVGTTRRLERLFVEQERGRAVDFAYSPENLRLGRAIDAFTQPDRVVVGVGSQGGRARAAALLSPIGAPIEWMSIESAEMTKHALNAFLATSIAFVNEIATVCEQVGADAAEVARGVKSDARIGPRAYLSPGSAFAGGTLARDLVFLADVARTHDVPTQLLAGALASNDAHRNWAVRQIARALGSVGGRRIAVWGLTYKPGTSTLRRSDGVALCLELEAQGAEVRAHDPAVRQLPPEIAGRIELTDNALDAIDDASALVLATPWPEYRQVGAHDIADRMKRRLVIDANAFLADSLGTLGEFEYLSVGRRRG
jgi:UDPglucose 6-dehydrogenase